MKEFYIKDENGKYISADGQCRFSKLKGRALYAYLNSAEGKTKRFLIEKDDRGVEIGVEVTDPKIIEETDAVSGHEYYLRKQEKKSGLQTVSIDAAITTDGEELSGEEAISDPDADIEAEVMHQMDLQTLHRALELLSPSEMEILYALYLSENPISERAYARMLGVPNMTLNDRKKAIFKKIRIFFEKSPCILKKSPQ